MLASAVSTANLDDNANAWVSIFEKMRDYLYVALCDINCCSMAVAMLQRLIVTLQLGEQAFRGSGAKSLTGALKLFVWQWRRLESRLPTNGLRIFARNRKQWPIHWGVGYKFVGRL